MTDTKPTTDTSASIPQSKTTETTIPPHVEPIPDVPDPEEDDLDDLDDLLDQFSANNISASGPGRPTLQTSSSAPAVPTTKDVLSETTEQKLAGDEFSAQLQKEMAALLGEIDENPEMKQQLDLLMNELTSSAEKAVKEETKKSAPPETGTGAGDAAFTDTIKKAMDRMAASEGQASAAATESGSQDDILAALLKDLASGGGEGSDEDFSKMLLGMMEQLTNKEILYDPMKELDDKFPDWIKKNEGKEKDDEMKRYKEQQLLVRECVIRFERVGYSDDNPEDREYIVERMQKMQASGNPPAELVGSMEETHNALGGIGNDCAQQ